MINLALFIERISAATGRTLAWLLFVLMSIVCSVVILRSGFKIGLIALQESVTYVHALLFMGAMAYALHIDAHVRVDIFYQRFSPRQRAWVNALGYIVLLFPSTFFIFFSSLDFFLDSWHLREKSSEAGGIAYVYFLKALIPLMALSLILQGLAALIQETLLLMNFKSGQAMASAKEFSSAKTDNINNIAAEQ